jgi:hypothetical protein
MPRMRSSTTAAHIVAESSARSGARRDGRRDLRGRSPEPRRSCEPPERGGWGARRHLGRRLPSRDPRRAGGDSDGYYPGLHRIDRRADAAR